jgi:excisionase family DNA binding protein
VIADHWVGRLMPLRRRGRKYGCVLFGASRMTRRPATFTQAYPPRALRADDAANYLGMSRSKFLDLVADGILPKPRRGHGLVLWDRRELDVAFESEWHSVDGSNTFDKVTQSVRPS